jgi:hypothetical protein
MSSLIPMRGLRMQDDLYLKLRHIANIENRSYNQQAIHVLQEFVARYEAEHGVIQIDTDELYQ